jgi:hypothetical protein
VIVSRRGRGDEGTYRRYGCYPTEAECKAAAIRDAQQSAGATKSSLTNTPRALAVLQSADPPLVARIAGPGVSDLADLEVPPLSEVDDAEACDVGRLPRIGTDPTRRDLRGAAS